MKGGVIVPRRIQRKRTKGWQMPEGAVSVCRPGRWGNPFIVSQKRKPGTRFGVQYIGVPTQEDAVECFHLMMLERPDWIEAAKRDLAGKDLACWCPLDRPCHADILLKLANE